MKTWGLGTNASVDVSGTLYKFLSKVLDTGSQISADQLDRLKVARYAQNSTIDVGAGGIGYAKIGQIYDSVISSDGNVGRVVVRRNMMGTSVSSNMNAGSDGIFGTIDDFVVDPAAAGAIGMVKVGGAMGVTGDQEVRLVASGTIDSVRLSGRNAQSLAVGPMIWQQAASQYIPLSIAQAALDATGFTDDEIWVSVFGQDLTTNVSYYLDSTKPHDIMAQLTETDPAASSSTSFPPTLKSATISDWKNPSRAWGSDLIFPAPPPNHQWSGRIVISAGVDVQAQIDANGSIASPSASDPIDPATGTFYDFLEFTVTADASGNLSLDIDTSLVDSFGMPMDLQLFPQNPTQTSFTGTLTANSPTITGITDTTGLAVGQAVVGQHIPLGATISSLTPSTTMQTGSLTLNMNASPSASGSETLTAVAWSSFDVQVMGTLNPSSNMITGINSDALNNLIKYHNLSTGQPVIADGFLPTGTTIGSYVIGSGNSGTITLTKDSLSTVPADSQVTFTVNTAGPVGVKAVRDEITGTGANSLLSFLQGKIDNGSAQARPFLESAAPFLLSGPVPIDGVTIESAKIYTPSVGSLQANDVITISGVQGTTSLNGNFMVSVIDSDGIVLGGPTGNGTYTNGGQWSVSGGSQHTITGATNDNTAIVISTASTTGLVAGDVVTISGAAGNTAANGTFLVAHVTSNSFTLGSPVGTQTYTSDGQWSVFHPASQVQITGASNANPIVITAANTTGLLPGDQVLISGVEGNTNANGVHTVSNLTATTFELSGVAGNSAYTGGGTWLQVFDITGATDGGEMLVTTGSTYGLADGDTVSISGVEGTTTANGVFTTGKVASNSFTLNGAIGNAAYVTNGTWSTVISGVATTKATITTSSTAGLMAGDVVTITGADGNTAINGQFLATDVTATTFALGAPIGNGAYGGDGIWSLPDAATTPITDVSNQTVTGPIVITTGNTTGLADGDAVLISGIQGISGANGVSGISNVTPTSFTLDSSLGVGTYTGGGSWQLLHRVTGATGVGTPIVITTASTAGLSEGGVVKVSVAGNSAADGQFLVTNVTPTTFTLGSPVGGGAYTGNGSWSGANGGMGSVTGLSNGGQIVISDADTKGLQNGSLVEVAGVLGNTGANGVYYVSNVTPNVSFTLDGATANGTYTSGGTWKEFTSLTRLVSPKDLVESLASPQDKGALNNYFNQVIDDFFLKYLPSDVTLPGGQVGGGQTFSIQSSASTTSSRTYSGVVTKGTMDDPTANGGYVLRLTSSDTNDTNNYDIYYPFFNSNKPSTDVYTPIFPTEDAPQWLSDEIESASQMVFACNAVFADNTDRSFTPVKHADPSTIMGDLENSVSAALNRGISLSDTSTWGDSAQWFPNEGTYNYWVEYWHQDGLTIGDLAYAFAYDDRFGASTNLSIGNVGLTQITLGNWSNSKTASNTSLQITAMPPVAANGSVTLTANVTGSSPTGTVTFFINGLAINSNNDSSSPTLQPVAVSGGTAALTANLPSLPSGTYTYTVTAVYSGDGTNLPSIGSTTLQVS